MAKVQIEIGGKQALVDDDQVKMLLQKSALVKISGMLAEKLNSSTGATRVMVGEQLRQNAGKIIRLNRKIRKNVQFL